MPTPEKLLEMFNQGARIGKHLGFRLDFDERGRAVVTLPHNPKLDHALGGTHGGVVATILDTAGWFTCAAAHPGDGWVATSELSMHLLRPAIRTELTARGEILKTGKRLDVAEIRCFDARDNLVAHATGTYVYLDRLSIQENRIK